MNSLPDYPIGTPGTPWGKAEIAEWLSRQSVKRSYQQQVVVNIEKIQRDLADLVSVEQYAELAYAQGSYPLLAIQSKTWRDDKPAILVTGGVHGYETSGVHGALRFVETELAAYAETFNFVVAPCVSPWGYETVNRWNPRAVDPNRSFRESSAAPEAIYLMSYIYVLDFSPLAHLDLHETTDTDNSEFRPALAARDAIEQAAWDIPDGFYLVGDSARPQPDFQRAIIESVAKVTHIAPADSDGKIIGAAIEQPGVINYAAREKGLCAGFTDAPFVTTTEVYPDSDKVDAENCVVAQVAAVTGALDFLKQSA